MKPETAKTWHPLKDGLDRREWMAQRLEDRSFSGIPDVNIHIPDVGDIWVELKYHARCPVRSVHLGLSKQQAAWLISNQRAGRRCLLLCRIEKKWYGWKTEEGYRAASCSYLWQELLTLVDFVYDDVDLVLDYLGGKINGT